MNSNCIGDSFDLVLGVDGPPELDGGGNRLIIALFYETEKKVDTKKVE